jgi:predicted RNA-binding protein with RPS1 domain
MEVESPSVRDGRTYRAVVTKVMDFGVFVELLPNHSNALLHISEISHRKVCVGGQHVVGGTRVGDQGDLWPKIMKHTAGGTFGPWHRLQHFRVTTTCNYDCRAQLPPPPEAPKMGDKLWHRGHPSKLYCVVFVSHSHNPGAQIRAVSEVLKVGEELDVLCLGRDQRGNIRISRKALLPPPAAAPDGTGSAGAASSRHGPSAARSHDSTYNRRA